MKATDTISVNPGKTTLGHVNTPSASIFRSPVLGAENNIRSVSFMSLVFPTVKSGVEEYTKYAVALRTLFATILIVAGITMLTSPIAMNGIGLAIPTLCFGGLLALGLFTRPIMAGASIFYGIFGALALRSGVADMTVFSMMFGCLLFCVIGAGRYSCDSMIRGSILRYKRKTERKRKAEMMGYKAFHNIKF